jgi:pilus assembly protein CpaB
MNKRALLVALASACAAVALFLLYARRFEQESSGGERVRVLVAVQALERGAQLKSDALTTREIPRAYLEDRAIRESDKAKVLGLRLGGVVQPQEILMWTDLAVAGDDRRDLSALVQPGRRALTIALRDDAASAGVKPGDYVDVIGLASSGAGGDARTASVLLQRALVLAGGDARGIGANDPKPAFGPTHLTLSVSLADAQLLAAAAERGTLSIALRSPEDNHAAEGVPPVTVGAVAEAAPGDDFRVTRRPPVAPRELRALLEAQHP